MTKPITAPTPEPLTVTRTVAAQMLGVCLSSIDNMLRDGRLRMIRCGRKPLVCVESLKAFARTGSSAPVQSRKR